MVYLRWTIPIIVIVGLVVIVIVIVVVKVGEGFVDFELSVAEDLLFL